MTATDSRKPSSDLKGYHKGNEQFDNSQQLEIQEASHEPNYSTKRLKTEPCNLYYCSICDKLFEALELLQAHITSHIVCSLCGSIFPNQNLLEKHIDVAHPQFSCDICDMQFTTAEHLDYHMESHIKCSFCESVFPNEQTLNQHLITTIHEPHVLHKCHVCVKLFLTAAELNDHVKSHKECSTCHMIFLSEDLLEEHKNIVHNIPIPFKCCVCTKQFTTKNLLKAHLKCHHNIFEKYDTSAEPLQDVRSSSNRDSFEERVEERVEFYIQSPTFQTESPIISPMKSIKVEPEHHLESFVTWQDGSSTSSTFLFVSEAPIVSRESELVYSVFEPSNHLGDEFPTSIKAEPESPKEFVVPEDESSTSILVSGVPLVTCKTEETDSVFECTVCARRFNEESEFQTHVAFHLEQTQDSEQYSELLGI